MKQQHNTKTHPAAGDLERYEELAIATAQLDMEVAIAKSGLQRSEIADVMGRPKSFISKIMGGGHNLTIRTMARLFAACGFELRFGKVSTVKHWSAVTLTAEEPQVATGASSEARADANNVACAGASEEMPCAA
jgi:hypothetical protein